MKTLIISSIVVLIVAAHLPTLHAQQFEFERSPNFQKLDGRARTAWIDAMRASDKKRELDCLVKVAERLDQNDKQRLASTGFKPGTIIQTIVTGRIEAEKLPALAGLDFVRVVELAVPLDIKKDPGYQKYGAPPAKQPAAKGPAVKPAPAAQAATPTGQKASPTPATTSAVPPVQQGEVQVEIPIYESTRPAETYPNKPPTSDELVDQEPAVSPPDQAVVPIGAKPTVTQPIVGKQPKPEAEAEANTQGPATTPTQTTAPAPAPMQAPAPASTAAPAPTQVPVQMPIAQPAPTAPTAPERPLYAPPAPGRQ